MTSRLTDIATRAGVSVSTVSRVLNERPGVNAHTRQQVLTALDVLGYDRPVRLRERSAGLVGLVLPELDNPFFPRLAHHIELRLSRAGLAPVLCSQTLGGIHEDDYVAMLLDRGVSGIVFVSGVHALAGSDPQRYRRLTDLGLPIAMINGMLPGVDAPFLSTDDGAAVGLALRHLEEMGHRRIGVALGQDRYTPTRRRRDAFLAQVRREDLAAEGLAPEDVVACTSYSIEGGVLAAHRLLDHGVTGIVCGSDVIALGVLREARRRGLGVPTDLSVVGSDDSPLMEFVTPALTTVRQSAAALAEAACREIIEQIAGKPPHVGEVLFRPELVVRESTARAPGG